MAKKVLIVDDMKSELQLISNYLQSAGYVVSTAENGEEAFEQAKASLPDIIVTDLVMPQITGLELCRLLKKDATTSAIPIVACTTKDRQVDQTWAKKQGVDAYVIKPCSQEELVSAVQSVSV
ncbi:response regulator [filamentous cyanobacterium LEGE 11480]|uniref:Response regulator n=1 Tax=Romeriopsis navalis LEGE 11480 TaxID=2777977 RepID=A0A928Z196_9CYAN|nr:response regulator [Romeriopsis navalis]MBE9029101.1 response regulator [Romeriopsis navalis LEGE 11480]